jgi:hypothetical protein
MKEQIIIAESKTTQLRIRVSYTDKHVTRGQVLRGDAFNRIGAVDYWSTSTLNIIADEHKEDSNIPKHYNNDNGTLYKVAQERGWNSYLFDIVKRLERSEKKGEFRTDLQKSKVVIDLWLKESDKL